MILLRPRANKWIPLALFVFLSVMGMMLTPHAAGASTPNFDNVVTIVMENHGINATYNCAANCTYITRLANTYGLAESYSALTHPSMANYIAMTSGGQYGTQSVQPPGSVNATNVVDRLEDAGLTWKAYMESYHGGCSDYGSKYDDNHNPFVKYADIYNNPARCAKIVNTGNDAGNASTSLFLSDLSSPTAPNYMWLTPNVCHDMHDCPLVDGDNYLANLVPQILSSYIFTNKRAALFITFDEGCCTFPRDYVTSIWAGPVANQGYKSTVFYDHYSYLRTLEDNWGLPYLTVNDTIATPMTEFFGALTVPPQPQPLIYGWGGVLAVGSVHFNGNNPASMVFTGEQASNTEVAFAEIKSRGYNGARVAIIDPGNQPDSNTYNSRAWHRTLALADYFSLYVIGDDHEYNITGSWLPFWRTVIEDTPQVRYPNVVWEAQNEPHDANLTADFQSFIDMDRSLGDTRWIVLGCNNSCSPDGNTTLTNFPIVNDPLDHVFYDFHEYYFYPDHSVEWNVSSAIAFADAKMAGIQNVIYTLHRPFLGTEWGAETGCSTCAPDQAVPGSAGYAPETLAYLTEIVSQSHRAGIGYTLWNAGDWNDPPAGTTGAMDTFGHLLPLPNGTFIQPHPPPRALFFAYGRDMLESVMEGYTNNTAIFVDTARVNGYSFVVDYRLGDGTGAGDMVSNATDFVEGVVYSIPVSSLALLDNVEGLNGSYARMDNFLVTSLSTGQPLTVSIYTVTSPQNNVPAPSGAYDSDVLSGIAQHNLGQAYSDKINRILNPPKPPPPPPPVGDVNRDGRVDIQDVVTCVQNLGSTGPNVCDVNRDGLVDIRDLMLVFANFGKTSSRPV